MSKKAKLCWHCEVEEGSVRNAGLCDICMGEALAEEARKISKRLDE